MKSALIFGISGQDGAYLAQLLLAKNYKVFGVSRDLKINDFANLKKLNILDQVQLISGNISNFNMTIDAIKISSPDEIYNLAGQSSVGFSFENPIETFKSIVIGTQNILDCIKEYNVDIKFFNAGSTECFGNTSDEIVTENSSFHPKNPYAIAKSAAFWQIKNYRQFNDIFCCTGILSNHESPLRGKNFVTPKIISTACRIHLGSNEKLHLGNLNIQKDWGWAPEYTEAMWLMLQQPTAEDFVIATGNLTSLKKIVEKVFNQLNLNYKEHVELNNNLRRPSDLNCAKLLPQKAENILGWSSTVEIDTILSLLISDELNQVQKKVLDE